MSKIYVYYVVQRTPQDGTSPISYLRTDVGKYFSQADAQKALLDQRIANNPNYAIEQRVEDTSQQHPAHIGLGSPAPG